MLENSAEKEELGTAEEAMMLADETLEGLRDTQREKQEILDPLDEAWNERDPDADNSALEAELSAALGERDDAEEAANTYQDGDWADAEALRDEKQQAWDQLNFTTYDNLEQLDVDIWAYTMWGREACEDCDPPVEEIVGVETRMRQAEKALNTAIQ